MGLKGSQEKLDKEVENARREIKAVHFHCCSIAKNGPAHIGESKIWRAPTLYPIGMPSTITT